MCEEARRLDERFEEILGKLKPFLLRLPVSEESRLCRHWLERLNRAEDQRALRNDYLVELYKQLKNDYLGGPFDKPPKAGKLIPISYLHRLPASSSCNELTETSLSLCEQKRSWPKPRSKSLRRDDRIRQPSAITRRHHLDSPSSLDENILTSPTVHFHEQDDNRHDRGLLRTYRERIETLNTIVAELESQNEKLKQKITYYHNASNSDQVSHLHARIKHLMNEIAILKKKLTEVYEIKALLEKNHQKVVSNYKLKMTEQFEKMKKQLENTRAEKKELHSKIATIELKLQELNQEKELSVKSNQKTWAQQIESVKQDYEQMLQEKEAELRKKDELVQQKEAEIAQKITEIQMLSVRLEELQQLMDIKSQEDMKLQSMLVSQYNAIKDELSQMRSNIEMASQKQSESHKQEITTLKKNLQKLEKQKQKHGQEYEKKISRIIKEKNKEINSLQVQLHSYGKYSDDSLFSKRRYEIGDPGTNPLAALYKEFLETLETTAEDKRYKYYEKLLFLEDSMHRLQRQFE